MTTFVANEFNPDTDTDRPKVGNTIEDGRTIKRVDWMLFSDVFAGKEPPSMEGYEVLMKEHSNRPHVIWVIWVTE